MLAVGEADEHVDDQVFVAAGSAALTNTERGRR
jgi:hypothetical protein